VVKSVLSQKARNQRERREKFKTKKAKINGLNLPRLNTWIHENSRTIDASFKGLLLRLSR
jgi:hypothetical protein